MLENAFDFGVKYFQNPNKMTRGRTSSQNRGLGAIIDANIVGKVIELGVNQILKQHSKTKIFLPDMEIRDKFDYGQPDVIKIVENGIVREPKCFVEVKNSPKNFLWVGLYVTQFQEMKNYVKGNEENIYIVYASLVAKLGETISIDEDDSNNDIIEKQRRRDILGIFLKHKKFGSSFDFFSDIDELYVQIDYIITGKELSENGQVFPASEPWASPEILIEANKPTNAKGNVRKNFKKLKIEKKKNMFALPTDRVNNSIPFPRQFGAPICKGNCEVYEETKTSSRNGGSQTVELKTLFLDCKTNVRVGNNFLGVYPLEANKTYRIKIEVKVDSKERDDLAFPKRNITSIVKTPPCERIIELATKI